jgi:hypothetical protein
MVTGNLVRVMEITVVKMREATILFPLTILPLLPMNQNNKHQNKKFE